MLELQSSDAREIAQYLLANTFLCNAKNSDLDLEALGFHEIKRHLFLGRKAMASLDSILKSRDITLPTRRRIVKTLIFSSSHVWM